jgi:hypothetical protein
MLPNREGRFKATILEHGVAETGPNNLATFVCRYKLASEMVDGEWLAVDEDFDITGYHYLEKKDGSINQVTVDSLKEAFGWDGRDPFWLQDADMANLVVQVKCGFEEYNGRNRLKVQFVDSEDSTGGGVPKADDTTRRSINTRLGPKFRAMAGGTPAPVAKPAAKPASHKPTPAAPHKSAPSSPTATAAPAESTMEAAWAEFTAACPGDKWTQDAVEKEWFRILAELFPGKQPDKLSPAEWGVMLAEGPGRIIPF